MTIFPELSALPIDTATDGLLERVFVVRPGTPEPWEDGLPEPERNRQLSDGSWARRWGAGPAVLLVHGFEGRWSQWTPLAKALINADVPVVILEMPGHGRAEGLPTNPLAFSEAVTAAGDGYGPFRAIVGHSQGATASLHAVAGRVETEKLVLLAPVASIEAHLRRVCRLAELSGDGTALFLNKVTRHVGVPPSDFYGPSLAKRVTVPTLIIHDEQDREAPFTEAQHLATGWQSATFHATSGLGHRRLLNNEDVVARTEQFVRHPRIRKRAGLNSRHRA